jgi:histidine triad (HIT) family protein
MADFPDCIFCKIVAGDIPSTKVHEDERTVAFMDVNPGARGHLLVVPREHAADLHAISDEDLAAVARTARDMAAKAVDRLGAEGVNIIQNNGRAAWQTVFHYHVHVVPRWQDDPIHLPWTPTPGDEAEIEKTAEELTS